MEKKFLILFLLATLISCGPGSENKESSLCKGKTVLKITESTLSSTVYFTDGTSYETYTLSGDMIHSKYHKTKNK